jgi:hypothetical protein
MDEVRSHVCLDLPTILMARPTKRLVRFVLESGLSADSEEKHKPVSDIDTAAVEKSESV